MIDYKIYRTRAKLLFFSIILVMPVLIGCATSHYANWSDQQLLEKWEHLGYGKSVAHDVLWSCGLMSVNYHKHRTVVSAELQHRGYYLNGKQWEKKTSSLGTDENPKTTRDPVTVSEVSPSEDYRNFIELKDFQIRENRICGIIKNKGDKTVEYLVIEANCLNSQGKLVQRKWYRVVPYGKSNKSLKPGVIISIKAGDHKILSSATRVQVSLDELRLD